MHEQSLYEVVRTASSLEASCVLVGVSDGFLSSSHHGRRLEERGKEGYAHCFSRTLAMSTV